MAPARISQLRNSYRYQVRSLAEGCGWKSAFDLSADRLERYLAVMRDRRPSLPTVPEGINLFTAPEVARLMGGVSRQSVAAMVRKAGLTAVGRGLARCYPRAVFEALHWAKNRGAADQTSNHYLQAVHQFARWLADNDRIDRSPFARVKPVNARLDQRRRRGELAPDELGRLLAAAEASKAVFRGLSGADREMLYRVTVGTGFRAAELAVLVPVWFDLDAVPPAIVLPAEYAKNRKTAVVPISGVLSSNLWRFLDGQATRQPVWPG